ncbi:MAG: globin domain-containing protein [Pseudomonadota bacterium]
MPVAPPSDIQKSIVRKGWATTALMQDQTARAFYSNLFQIAPQTRALFRGDMDVQGRKLVNTLGFVVDHLDDAETLLPEARELAVRHVRYGVTADQYDAVGAALLQTLQDLLGDGFGAEDRAAWAAVYESLAHEMKRAAYP